MAGKVGVIAKVTRRDGSRSTSRKPSSIARSNSACGVIRWSLVSTANTASGSSLPTTAAPNATAFTVSRPIGSPRTCASSIHGMSARMSARYFSPAQT